MAISERRMTLEEFLKLPEKKPALEFEDGRITQKVSPLGKHSVVQFATAEIVNRFVLPKRVAMAFPELRTTYTDRSYVPDVAVYRWERIPRDADGKVADYFWEPPDIAIEIRSPSQRVNRLLQRLLWYVDNGVPIALLLDPSDESVRLTRPDHTTAILRGSDIVDLSNVLPGFTLTVQQIFDALTL